MSIDAFLINLIIGTATFFLLQWALNRLIKTNKALRTSLTWAGTFILTPFIYLGLIVATFGVLSYEPSCDFDKERWFANKEKRYEMRDNIVASEILLAKDKKELIELIGLPDYGTDTSNIWNYDLGESGAGFGWQFNFLLVTFDNDRVVKVEKQEIVD